MPSNASVANTSGCTPRFAPWGDGEPDAITARLARAFADLTVIDVLSAELAENGTHSIATISAPILDDDRVVSMSASAAPFAALAAAEVERLGERVRAAARRIEAQAARVTG